MQTAYREEGRRRGQDIERTAADLSYHGGLVVAISNTVQPTLQMSDLKPWPVSMITSGAIQYGVPVTTAAESHSATVVTTTATL